MIFKKLLFLVVTLYLFSIFSLPQLFGQSISKSYIQVYGEGKIGQHFNKDLNEVWFTTEDAVLMAQSEIFEFIAGMVYGYRFELTTENPVTGRKGFFDITKISGIRRNDPNLKLSQLEESPTSLKLQATYRLHEAQKNYINGFMGSEGQLTKGTGRCEYQLDWGKRIDAYKEAINSGIINTRCNAIIFT